jgi:hypothetical protein
MRTKKVQFLTLLIAAVTIFTLFIFPHLLMDRPTITYFPENPRIRYVKAETNLNIQPEDKIMRLHVSSQTNETNDLMQDFSLLYRNNRLVSILNRWQKNTRQLSSSKELELSSGFYTALSVHQAERHIDQSIYGKEQLSQDFLMVVPSNGSFRAFREPKSTVEANQLSNYTRELDTSRRELLRKAAERYEFRLSDYRVVPLDALTGESVSRIFPFEEKKSERITGQLWEGLYKNYVRGIQLTQGQHVQALGSTMPLLLIAQDHMLIIIETATRQIVLLRQNFS